MPLAIQDLSKCYLLSLNDINVYIFWLDSDSFFFFDFLFFYNRNVRARIEFAVVTQDERPGNQQQDGERAAVHNNEGVEYLQDLFEEFVEQPRVRHDV